MHRTLRALLALVAAVSPPTAARAQRTPLSVEPRLGFFFPVSLTREDVKTGFTAGGDLIVRLTPLVSVYGGYEYQRTTFKAVDSAHVAWRGWDGGVRLTLSPWGPYTPILRGGLIYQQGRTVTDGGTVFDGGWATGFQAGVGMELGVLGERAAVVPQLSFNGLQDVQWFNAEVALHLRL